MLRLRIILIAALVLAVSTGSVLGAGPREANARQAPLAISLAEAIDQKLVEAIFISNGAASGSSVVLSIRRTEALDLSITVRPGMLLLNEFEEEQDMVVLRLLGETTGGTRYLARTTIELRDDASHEYLLDAYCIEAHLDNPSEDAIFTPDGYVAQSLVEVVEAAGRVRAAEGNFLAIQAAIWALTDDITAAELDEIGYRLSSADLAVARAILAEAGFDPASFRLFRG